MSDARARRIAEALIAREGTASAWGLSLDEVREGSARVRMTVRQNTLNGHGTVHCGMIFALAHSAFAYACNSHDVATVAQGASIAFLAPASMGDVLVAEAREIIRVNRSGTYQVEVPTADGRAIASFHGLSQSIGGSILNPKESV